MDGGGRGEEEEEEIEEGRRGKMGSRKCIGHGGLDWVGVVV